MAIEVLLDLIRQGFGPADRKVIAESLQQDPLVWQFVQNEDNLPYFEAAESTKEAFSPGAIIRWQIEKNYGWDILTPEADMPETLRAEATRALESTVNAGLPPMDLHTAGLLTVALLNSAKAQGSWRPVINNILIKQGALGVEKNIQIWQTPAACLFSFEPEFNAFIDAFLQSEVEATRQTGYGLCVHALLSNPLPQTEKLDELYNRLSYDGINAQLQVLKTLEKADQSQTAQLLASSLMQVRSTADFMARTYAELETFQTPSDRIDPLQKAVRMALTEDLSKLAALLHYAGNESKSSAAYHSASEILSFIKTQAQFQSVAGKTSPEVKTDWIAIIQAVPHSPGQPGNGG